jgi:predicted negative regulator of RcsB-dependent stress response
METDNKNGGDKIGVIIVNYGDILFMLGDKENAVEKWKRALQTGDGTKFLDEKIKQERYLDN